MSASANLPSESSTWSLSSIICKRLSRSELVSVLYSCERVKHMFMQPTYRALVAEPVVGTGRLGGSSYRHSVSISSHDEQGCPPLHYKAKVVSLACLAHRCVVDSGRRTRDLRVRHDRHATETLFRLRALVVWCWSAPFWWGTKTPSGVTLGMFFFYPMRQSFIKGAAREL